MGIFSKILVVIGVAFITEVAYKFVKHISQHKNVNTVITFDDSCYSCNKNKNEPCFHKSCRIHNLNKIIQYMDSATVSMDLCLYMLSCPNLKKAIVRAYKRGVVVRVITDLESGFSNSLIHKLYEEGIQVRWKKSSMLMHHKYCIIDSGIRVPEIEEGYPVSDNEVLKQKALYKYGLVLTGSMNWTAQATMGNWENIIVTSEQDIVEAFQIMFNQMWEDFGPQTKNK